MKNLTTPKAILIGLGLIALAIAIQPVSSGLIGMANANANQVTQVEICGWGSQLDMKERQWKSVWSCMGVQPNGAITAYAATY